MTGSMLQQGLSRSFSLSQRRLLAAVRVGIAGAGGLGSNCAVILARSGIRSFTIADFDCVDSSNLNRQFYFPDDVGKSKIEALAQHLKRIDESIDLCLENQAIGEQGATTIFTGCSIVIEALDNPVGKAELCNTLLPQGVFMVCASGIGGIGGLSNPPLRFHRLGTNLVCVGDFITGSDKQNPPLAPRVMQVAAMQAALVLEYILTQGGSGETDFS